MKYLPYLLVLFLFSFKQPNLVSFEDRILGVWIPAGHENKIYTFEKAEEFDQKKAGVEFKKRNKLIKRENADWCGTPPISYRNYDGIWASFKDGETINLRYEFWGGMAETKWKITELSETSMNVTVLDYKTEKR